MAKKILIVDDEHNIVNLIASRLRQAQYEVMAATDGIQAIIEAHEKKPDLIILDIKMPAGSGVTVFESLRKSLDTAFIPVIFLTAYPDEDVKKKVMELGAADFIPKPFDADELMAKVKKALEGN